MKAQRILIDIIRSGYVNVSTCKCRYSLIYLVIDRITGYRDIFGIHKINAFIIISDRVI